MPTVDERMARWLGVVGDLLAQPLTEMPRETLANELTNSFDVTTVTWQWQDGPGDYGFDGYPMPATLSDAFWEMQRDPATMDAHPLLRWYARTCDPLPQSTRRVPSDIAGRHGFEIADTVLRSYGCEQQLSIPYSLAPSRHRAFVLSRSTRDFNDDDVRVATTLQCVLVGLDRQVKVLAARLPVSHASYDGGGLTGRELSVLLLLVEGHTAFAIGRRLGVSPRTVQKHLEHIYRKLRVNDRVGAVRMAVDMGLWSLR